MLDDVARAVSQMLSPPMRALLWKAVGLALALIVIVAVLLNRVIGWLLGAGSAALESGLGPQLHTPATIIAWLLSIAAALGILVGSVLLMPAVTAFVGSFFADQIADEVERANYPADPRGAALPPKLAFVEGGKTALLAILVYLCALPFLLFAGFGVIVFFLATAWLLGREYFDLAAMRFRSRAEAHAMRKRNAGTVYLGGLLIAAFVSIPIVNLATPLFAMSLMVHVHKRLDRRALLAGRTA
jgi:CysZ protein